MTRLVRPLSFMALLVMVGAPACVPQAPSVQGRAVNQLYEIFAVIASIIFVLTAALIAFSKLRFRAKPSDDTLPPQLEGNVKLELIWFAIPTAIVVVLFILTLQKLDIVTERSLGPQSVIEVEAYQWGWSFTYRGEGVNISGGPQDEMPSPAVPTGSKSRSNEPGRYIGKCSEFCGLSHAEMNFVVRAVRPHEYRASLNERKQDNGKRLNIPPPCRGFAGWYIR